MPNTEAEAFNANVRKTMTYTDSLIPLYTGNPQTGTLANSDDPDEMQDNAAFHQGLHYLLRLKQPSGTDILHN